MLEVRIPDDFQLLTIDWIFCFLVVMIIPPAFANIGWKTYIIFAIFNALFVPMIYFYLPETRRRSLEELDVVFASGIDPVKAEKQMPYGISVAEQRRALGLEEHSDSYAEVLEDVSTDEINKNIEKA